MATRRKNPPTPVTSAFEQAAEAAGLTSQPGLGAVKGEYRDGLSLQPGHRHTASIDLDSGLRAAEPTASRWDYGIGLSTSAGAELLVWVEAHPASSTGEVQKMLDKLAWLKDKLARTEFADLRALQTRPAAYRWLARTGGIRILPGSKEARRLALAGLSAPQRHIQLP